MTIEGYIAILFFAVAALLIGIKVYKNIKNKDGNFEEIFDKYSDNIISVIQSSISILKVNIDDYPTQEAYENAIIDTTYNQLKANNEIFGIDEKYFDILDSEIVKDAIRKIFNNNKVRSFLRLDVVTMSNHKNIIDDEVLEARIGNNQSCN